MGEKNKFLSNFSHHIFSSFVILLVTQKLKFFEENFKIKTSPPFFVGRPDFASIVRDLSGK